MLIAAGIWWLWPEGELRHEPGVRLDREPVQETIAPQVVANFKKYTITAVAAYAIEARVLHTKRYWADGNDLVPYDVAVGWGAMSDQAVLDRLSISQGNRFFFYEWQNPPPVAVSEIERHAANMHVIAANKDLPVGSVRELIDYAKARPGKLNFGAIAGFGTSYHLAWVLFAKRAGIDVVQIPFKGVTDAMQAVVGGDVELTMSNTNTLLV